MDDQKKKILKLICSKGKDGRLYLLYSNENFSREQLIEMFELLIDQIKVGKHAFKIGVGDRVV